MNAGDFDDKYYVIVKDLDNTYWLLNPVFPCKVTYTYIIGANENHTDFTVSIKSNLPILKVNNFTNDYSKPCESYNLCGVDILELNEKEYSVIDSESVSYTNDGFKNIIFKNNTCTFTEQFDGTYVSHQVKFNIDFDSYKSSWHYNLLEFADNKYAMILKTKCGTNIATGFNHGLQPSFVINGSDKDINSIEITLSDFHDEGTFIQLPTDVPYSYLSATSWVWVDGEYECVSTTTAKRLLMEEVDALCNHLDLYKCLEGYRVDYEYLADKLVGEFTEIVTFPCDACRWSECVLQTSMPTSITFNGEGQEKTFTLYSPTEWSITTDSGITVTPSSGTGGGDVDYITIKNNTVPTSGIQSHTIVVNYCNKTDYFYADVVETSPTQCYPLGQYYNIDYNAQEVLIPTNCCISGVSANTVNLKNFTMQKGYVRMWADANDTGTGRTMTLLLTDCTSATTEIYIYQSSFLSEWVTEQTVCNGRFKCDFQRLYSGLTQDSITAATYVTRWANCSASTECQEQNYKWVESQDTYCDSGNMYYLEYLYVYENGSWRRTSGVRYGSQAIDASGKCATHIEHWILDNGYYCDNTIKYKKERLYYEEHYGDPQSAWTETDVYRMGEVEEMNSLDCGYGTDSGYTYQQWRPDSYICLGGSKYTTEKKYVSNDTVNWVSTDIYRVGTMAEQYSTECGWESAYTYRWVTSNEQQCGSGENQYNLYQMYEQERRPVGSVSELDWETVVPYIFSYDADGTEDPILIESGSSQCNAPAPPFQPEYRWVVQDSATTYYCSGTTKYAKEAKQISMDNGETWSYLSPMEYRMGDVLEVNSIECGYVPTHDYSTDYLTFVAQESGTFKFSGNSLYYSLDSGETWTALASNTNSQTVSAGSNIMWKASGLTPTSSIGIGTFTSTSNFTVEGNVMSLMYGDNFEGQVNLNGKNYAFVKLFSGCTTLTSAENMALPATTLTEYCYMSMFNGCTSLTTAPQLLTTTLESGCYFRMFEGCTSLTTAPSLPATSLTQYCYTSMFHLCTSLTTAPALPATTLANDCYYGMFDGCTSLTTAPALPATTLANDCYSQMFYGCTSLTTAPTLPAPTLTTRCYQNMFQGCTSLNSITCLATDISATYCTNNWVYRVASAGTFTKAASMSSWPTGNSGIPSGWTVQDYS